MLRIRARVDNSHGQHAVSLSTNDREQSLAVAAKPDGYGSSVNGGEMLFLALATCYCNDLYREAGRRGIAVRRVEVEVRGEFAPVPGAVAENVTYDVRVEADAPEDQILNLIRHTDTVAEVQNSLRQGVSVRLGQIAGQPV
ncbi:MAG: OsmC family protein [Anaerolineae bacterium]|nr:OsmC family protein [Anaerolineae bacterium]